MEALVRGGLAGLIGTLVMSLVMAGGRAAGLMSPAPKQITENLQRRAGVRHEVPEPAFRASWIAAHLGFGTACGALYALLRPLLPSSPILAGAGFGIAVWAVSYLGLMPGLRLFPKPTAVAPPRMAGLIVAHLVFGVTMAETERWLRDGEQPLTRTRR